jgi:hypothetical protein
VSDDDLIGELERWLTHRDYQPTPMQRAWLEARVLGWEPVWAGGRASGRTWAERVLGEFLEARDAS